ncbi:MAG TPA: MauE/DoxX family redox-associated membrane protein [Vicinamibacteria bacterium]|nr:MauE/DoxX family redox-associated membrane protein [Vicinamibacteria bacterium]
MSGLLRHPRTHLLVRLVLGGFFVFASLDKIASPAAFAKIVYQWQVIGPVPSNLVAVTLPWIELVAGLLLIAGVWKRESALVIALMLVVFIVAAGAVMARGIDVENCGCVSLAKAGAPTAWPPAWMKGVGWFLVGRNLVLLAASLVIVFLSPLQRPFPASALGQTGDGLRSEPDSLRRTERGV